MPLDRSHQPVRHPPNGTAEQRLRRRQAVAAGSPLHRDEPVPRPDTSVTARCEECHARFIAIGDRSAEDNLARHAEDKHVKTSKTPAATGPRSGKSGRCQEPVVP